VFVTAEYVPDTDSLSFANNFYGSYDNSFGETYVVPLFIVHGSLAGYLINADTYLAQETQYDILDEDHVA
jgi:hypothetical protein